MGKLICVDDIVERLVRVIQFGCRDSDGEHPISAESVLSVIESSPAVDAVPVRHGYWIRHDDADIIDGYYVPDYECSVCHAWKQDESDYCPDCGAKMDGKDGDNHG